MWALILVATEYVARGLDAYKFRPDIQDGLLQLQEARRRLDDAVAVGSAKHRIIGRAAMRKETANDVGILQIVMCEDCGEPSMQLLVAFFAGVEQSGAFALDDGAEPIGAIRGPDAELEGDDGLAARGAQLSTGDPLTETMLAAGYTLAHDLATAAIHVDRALTLDGGSAWAWGRSGWIKAYGGEAAEAIERFQIARALAPGDPMDFLCSVGIRSPSWPCPN